uniref:RNA-dependent RNA polymerase n=1 Tax=Ceratobasidium partitivirus TaxID=1905681 RepID=A0A219WGI2_9VIRU|nr:RNA-dependent RNA polymerase [Ceratobasidium partitivirus]
MLAFLSKAFSVVRNLYSEFYKNREFQWQQFNTPGTDPKLVYESLLSNDHRDYRKIFTSSFVQPQPHDLEQYMENLMSKNASRNRPFQFYAPILSDHPIPDNRQPSENIEFVHAYYHPGNVIRANPETSRQLDPDYDEDAFESYLPGDVDFGPPIDQQLLSLIYRSFPTYLPAITEYCRPAGTTDATFRDFNKPQKPSMEPTPERRSRIMKLIDHFMDIKPYLPIHFVDTAYCKLPLVTGTGYHNRHSYVRRTYAHFSHPETYATKHTSKGYFFNASKFENRTLVHLIKKNGFPLTDKELLPENFNESISDFLKKFPTLLFTRNHISKRDGTLKVRPVYAVDDLFLDCELMLTFPATVQARKPSCCIMYGLETIRGSNVYLDQLACQYKCFATIDWSGYDQHLPWVIVYIFFMYYLPSLIIVSHGYSPTVDYPQHPDLNIDAMFHKMWNLLQFTMQWYFNMVFLSADGYAYRRLFAGVPSGLFLTQFLDSFGNLYLIIDSLIEFGCSDDEIMELLLFIMGDDNSIFCLWDYARLVAFITFMEKYALSRWNMTLSKTKSVITTLRSKIETLGYSCNFGRPKRDINKLVAQLCFPEHGLKPQFMSARAIGLAYASCAQDLQFHEFCRQVYLMYLPVADMSPLAVRNTRVWILKLLELEETESLIPLDHFPSMNEILKLISYYHGPLDYEPKWNRAHFTSDPDFAPTDYVTIADYLTSHDLPRPSVAC